MDVGRREPGGVEAIGGQDRMVIALDMTEDGFYEA